VKNTSTDLTPTEPTTDHAAELAHALRDLLFASPHGGQGYSRSFNRAVDALRAYDMSQLIAKLPQRMTADDFPIPPD
jgi:hypothetical protein